MIASAEVPESLSKTVFDLAVAGGGVLGLSIAYVACRRGLRVVVVDEPRPRQAATPASAGVIWPIEPLPDDSSFWPWVRAGLAAYPGFIDSLGPSTAAQIEYQAPGILRLGCDESTLLPGETFAPAGSLSHCPTLEGGLVAEAACVSPPLLLNALRDACRQSGVVLLDGSVQSVGDSSGWDTSAGRIRSRKKAVTTGAWGLEGVAPPASLHPVRGQMLALELEEPWAGPMLQGEWGYLIARTPTRVVLGATVEDVGFDASTTENGRREILECSQDILAPLGPFRVTQQWAGLRPRIGAGADPYIGEVQENVAVALGLFRLGITTAPAVAEHLVAWAES